MSEILWLENVSCGKKTKAATVVILRDISFCMNQGEIVALLGPSGSGKSTLLRAIVGLDEIFEGRLFFHEKNLLEWDIRELRRKAGLVLQLPYLFAGSVRDNLLYGPRLHHPRRIDESDLAAELLDQVGLPIDLIERRASDLSVGQQMRVSLGRTLANRPELLLLDEPTASLDPASSRHIVELIQRLNRERGIGVLAVTHERETARSLGGRWMLLQEGQLTQPETADSLPFFETQSQPTETAI
ncbi:MAG: ATP-binding cassette domain-containing protein [Candidatus Omnitrophota bacterium]